MNKITNFLEPGIEFIRTNLDTIVVVLVSAGIFFLGYYVTVYSLGKLKPKIVSYYPFDKFFPKSGRWSVVYFLITVILLGALVYIIIRGGFYLAPA